MNSSTLFQPVEIGTLHLRNRIVMAPMTRCFSPKGVPGDNVAAYYARRAMNNVGLIITEGTWIPHLGASDDENVPRFYGDDALAGWAKVVSAVHDAGGRIMPQLWHVGLSIKAKIENLYTEAGSYTADRVGPSGLAGGQDIPLSSTGQPMAQAEIDAVIDAYATAAASAQALGFDGVELHAAHGYLIDQFFWDQTNLRTDRYGGDITKRARFAEEIVQEIRVRTGPSFPIALRISQWKVHDYDAKIAHTPSELEMLLQPLADAGVDIFDCSQRRFWEPAFDGSQLNLAGWAKKLTGKASMTVGSVGLDREVFDSLQGQISQPAGIERILAMVDRAEVDLVAVGRSLLGDFTWARKVEDGELHALNQFDPASLTQLV